MGACAGPLLRGQGAAMTGMAGASRRRQARLHVLSPCPPPPQTPSAPQVPAAPGRPGPQRHQCSIAAARTTPMFHRCCPSHRDRPPGAAPLTLPPRPPRPAAGQAGSWQSWRGPLYRGCVPQTPNGRAAAARPAAMCHVVNVAAITRWRARRAGRLGIYPRWLCPSQSRIHPVAAGVPPAPRSRSSWLRMISSSFPWNSSNKRNSSSE